MTKGTILPDPEIPLMTRKQVIQYLGISPVLLWKLQKHPDPKRRLLGFKVGSRHIMYRFDEIVEWLEGQRHQIQP